MSSVHDRHSRARLHRKGSDICPSLEHLITGVLEMLTAWRNLHLTVRRTRGIRRMLAISHLSCQSWQALRVG